MAEYSPRTILRGMLSAICPDCGHLIYRATTLAGNLTILGSVANLIVIERSRGTADIGFWEYSRTGIPVTLITILIGVRLF